MAKINNWDKKVPDQAVAFCYQQSHFSSPLNWSLEHELLLRCCQPILNKSNLSEIHRILESPLNWQRIQRLSFIHELSPILYLKLRSRCSRRYKSSETKNKLASNDQIPEKVLSKLKQQWLDNSLQNMIYFAELEAVLRKSAEASVPVVVLKSIPLLESVYQEIGTRVLNDLDILVKREHLSKMENLLSDLGYSYYDTNLGNHNRYFNPKKGIMVEVHWDLVNANSPVQKYAFKLNMDEIWKETGKCEIGETEAFTLSLEHSIIYLCVHLFKEDFGSFKWLGDISGVLHYYRDVIDWEKLCDYVAQFQLNKIVYYILTFVAQRLDAPVPKKALRSIRPEYVRLPFDFGRRIDKKLIDPIADARFIKRYKIIRYLTVIPDLKDKIAALIKVMAHVKCIK